MGSHRLHTLVMLSPEHAIRRKNLRKRPTPTAFTTSPAALAFELTILPILRVRMFFTRRFLTLLFQYFLTEQDVLELHCLEEKWYDEEDALVRPVNVISTCETYLKSGCQSATSNCI